MNRSEQAKELVSDYQNAVVNLKRFLLDPIENDDDGRFPTFTSDVKEKIENYITEAKRLLDKLVSLSENFISRIHNEKSEVQRQFSDYSSQLDSIVNSIVNEIQPCDIEEAESKVPETQCYFVLGEKTEILIDPEELKYFRGTLLYELYSSQNSIHDGKIYIPEVKNPEIIKDIYENGYYDFNTLNEKQKFSLISDLENLRFPFRKDYSFFGDSSHIFANVMNRNDETILINGEESHVYKEYIHQHNVFKQVCKKNSNCLDSDNWTIHILTSTPLVYIEQYIKGNIGYWNETSSINYQKKELLSEILSLTKDAFIHDLDVLCIEYNKKELENSFHNVHFSKLLTQQRYDSLVDWTKKEWQLSYSDFLSNLDAAAFHERFNNKEIIILLYALFNDDGFTAEEMENLNYLKDKDDNSSENTISTQKYHTFGAYTSVGFKYPYNETDNYLIQDDEAFLFTFLDNKEPRLYTYNKVYPYYCSQWGPSFQGYFSLLRSGQEEDYGQNILEKELLSDTAGINMNDMWSDLCGYIPDYNRQEYYLRDVYMEILSYETPLETPLSSISSYNQELK
ncbi:hypothetical protein WA158_006822 [Blastocystis sp. Blastoise]